MTLNTYLQKVNKTHLIFDFDRTLVRLLLPWDSLICEEPIKDALIKLDKSIYDEFAKGLFSRPDMENKYVIKFGYKAKQLLIKNRHIFEQKYLKGLVPNKELIEFIKKSNKYNLFIWSGNTKDTVTKALKTLQLENRFEIVVSGDLVKLQKPYIEGFEKIHDKQIPKNQYLMIGDSDSDRDAAIQANIDFFLVDYFKSV